MLLCELRVVADRRVVRPPRRPVIFPRIAEEARNVGVSVARALEPQFRHARLESRGFEPELIGGAADAANPPPGAVEHALDVLLLHVGEPDAAPRGGGGRLRQRDGQTWAGWRRSPRAPPDCAARGRCPARRIAAASPCCLSGSTRRACRTPPRSPRRSATPASGMSSVRSRRGGTRIGKTFSR